MWITGNDTKHRTVAWQENSSLELQYTHNLTLSDHGKTLFWCDVIWGQENIHGQSYTANVGCKFTILFIFLNDILHSS